MEIHRRHAEPWKVTLVDTGETTLTGGRLRRVAEFLDETFFFTYGDGVADINITELLNFHRSNSSQATLTAVQPPGRYGSLCLDQNKVTSFQEKPAGDGGWVNGGYFVLEPSVLDLLDGDDCVWESHPLTHLANSGQLNAYFHHGFWQPMDTLRDRHRLEDLWSTGSAPWRIW